MGIDALVNKKLAGTARRKAGTRASQTLGTAYSLPSHSPATWQFLYNRLTPAISVYPFVLLMDLQRCYYTVVDTSTALCLIGVR